MPYSPLVSKIRVHNPNRKGSANANRNAVIYIATREGVSLEQVDNVNDLLRIGGMEEKEVSERLVHQEADNENYLRYIAKRPRSHGLFGNINTDDLQAVSSEVAELTKKGRVIYRGIISLSKKDGEALDFRNAAAWNNYLKEVMPEIAQKLGVSSVNHTWVAAFHAEESHPHVHYMLWDNEDRVKSPYIYKATQQKIRIYLEERMFDNEYEKTIRQVHQEELDDLKLLRKEERSFLMKNTEHYLREIGYVPGVGCERLPQRIPNECLESLSEEVKKLIPMLPEHGSLKVKYMPEKAKKQLGVITEKLLERPDMQNSYERYLQGVKNIHRLYGESGTKAKTEMERAERDIKHRIANRVLSEIKNSLFKDMTAGENTKSVGPDIGMEEYRIMDEVSDTVLMRRQDSNMERNLVPFMEKQVEEKFILNNYFIDWNPEYKNAVAELYQGENFQKVFDRLETQAIKGNVLAIADVAKMLEKNLIEFSSENEAIEYYNEAFRAFNSIYESNRTNDYLKNYAAYRIGKLYEFGKGDLEVDYKSAEEWYKRAKDNAFAQYKLGSLYLKEKYPELYDIQKAIEYLEKSAKQGNEYAQYKLGSLYTNEKNPDLYNIGKAMEYLEKSAEQGNEYAQYKLASLHLNEETPNLYDLEKAVEYLKRSAEQGNVSAQYKLGSLYVNRGNPDTYDMKKAIEYLEKSSKQGNEYAQYKLGMLYLSEENPDMYDVKKAIEYLEKSSKQGNEYAQYKLGVLYLDEENPDLYNIGKAMEYLEKSSEQGNKYAQYKLGVLYLDEENPDIYDIGKAIEYLEKSSEQGNEYAQYKLGMLYLDEENPDIYDIGKAIEYLEKSSEQGNEYAQYKLGSLYANEENPDLYNIGKAMEYLEKSSEQGNEYAQYKLGSLYANEENPDLYNIGKAMEYLEKSAEQGNEYAQCRLGIIYYFGKGMQKNQDLGRFWLEQSSEQGNELAKAILGGPTVGIDFAYCLLKGVLSAMETLNRQQAYEQFVTRTQSRQAMKEAYMHRDSNSAQDME